MCVCVPGVSGELPLFLPPLESFTVFTASPLTLLVVVSHQTGCQFTWCVTSERQRHIMHFISWSTSLPLSYFAPVTHLQFDIMRSVIPSYRWSFILNQEVWIFRVPGWKLFRLELTLRSDFLLTAVLCKKKSTQESCLKVKLLYLDISCESERIWY